MYIFINQYSLYINIISKLIHLQILSPHTQFSCSYQQDDFMDKIHNPKVLFSDHST